MQWRSDRIPDSNLQRLGAYCQLRIDAIATEVGNVAYLVYDARSINHFHHRTMAENDTD